jgi:hypothetical protein
MVVKNDLNRSAETSERRRGFWNSLKEFVQEKLQGFTVFQRIMLFLYLLMAFFFLATALYLVFTEGFK